MMILDLDKIFTYHAPKWDQASRYERIRAGGLVFAQLIKNITPNSPEQTLAIRKIQEAVMFANAAIAIHETDFDAEKEAAPKRG